MTSPTRPASRDTPAMEAKGLWKYFGDFVAVKDVSLRVFDDESVAIIGPNGAGKSTLFDLLTARKTPDRGEVHLFGRDVSSDPSWSRVQAGVGRSFQITSIFPSLSTIENVQMGMIAKRRRSRRAWGRASATYADEASAILERVELADLAMTPAGELSHGDRRSLELAVTLATEPEILLLDEPTAGMGIDETDSCLSLIRSIAETEAIPVVFVEHDMDVVFSFATRIIVMFRGEVLVKGTPQEVRNDDRVKEAYFGEAL